MADPFFGQGLLIEGIHFLDAKDAQADVQRGARIVDLRQPLLVMMKSIDLLDVVYLDYSRWQSDWPSLPADVPLILVDAVGVYSKRAALFLKERGRADVAVLNGGFEAWQDAGLPICQDPSKMLQGGCACRMRIVE